MDEDGALIRLYPVPFRLITDNQQFRKWQWISARIRKSQDDRRRESHRISVDTIDLEGDPIPTTNFWAERREILSKVEIFDDFDQLEEARKLRGVTLALLRPSRLIDLQISRAATQDWTEDELAKLLQAQQQGSLFDKDAEQQSIIRLRKLPYDFHYTYECATGKSYKHKLVDWEAGALYWNVAKRPNWEAAFRQRFLHGWASHNVLFLMGTIHRFPNQWLIVSVIYPPRPPAEAAGQGQLFPP